MLARDQDGRGLYEVLREDGRGDRRALREDYRQIVSGFFQTALGRARQKAFRRRDRKPLRNFPLTHLFLNEAHSHFINRRPRFRFSSENNYAVMNLFVTT
jgi:hypothetical protein